MIKNTIAILALTALLVTTSASATESPGCIQTYKDFSRKSPAEKLGIGISAAGLGGTAVAVSGIGFSILLPPALIVALGGGAVFLVSMLVHEGHITNAIEIIQAAYHDDGDAILNRNMNHLRREVNRQRLNQNLPRLTNSEKEDLKFKIKEIIRRGNDSQDFCPIVKYDANNQPIRAILLPNQIRRYVMHSIGADQLITAEFENDSEIDDQT